MAEFNPDAFLRATAPKAPKGKPPAEPPAALPVEPPEAFNPDAFLASTTPPKVGAGETFVNQAVNTLPLGRMLVNLLSTGAVQGAKLLGAGQPSVRFTPEARAELEAQGTPVNDANVLPGVLDTYRQMRDTRDIRTDAGNEQNPWARRAGTGAGFLLSMGMPLPAALGGGSAARSAAQVLTQGAKALPSAARVGATMGALQAAGDSRADLTSGSLGEFAQQGAETALGGAFGGALGKATPLLTAGARNLLNRWGVNLGRKVLLPGGTDSQSARKALAPEVVEEALKSGAILPFGTTQGTLGRLNRLTEEVGAQYGDIVEGLADRGVEGLEVAPLVDQLRWKAVEKYFNTGKNKETAKAFWDEATNLLNVAQGEGRIGLKQAEEIKRSLMREIPWDRVTDPEINVVRKQIASMVREANEQAVEEAAQRSLDPEIIERAESFVPVKQRLGRLLGAEDAAARGAARTGQKSVFGLQDFAAGAAAGEPVSGTAAILASKLARSRLPSTGASAFYWGSRAVPAISRLTTRGGAAGQAPSNAAEEASDVVDLEAISRYLGGVTPTEDAAARAAALRRRR